MLATLTDATALWTLRVIKVPGREKKKMPHGKVIHPLPIIRGAHAPEPAASWEVSSVIERGRNVDAQCAIRSARSSHGV